MNAASDSLDALGPRLTRLFHESWKYLLVSIVALAVDFGLFASLTKLAHMDWHIAFAIGFSAGLVVNYLLSITLVFNERRLRSRMMEFVGFFVIGALGYGLNVILMKLFVDDLRLDPLLAKVPATGVSFVFNFVTRRVLLFTAAR